MSDSKLIAFLKYEAQLAIDEKRRDHAEVLLELLYHLDSNDPMVCAFLARGLLESGAGNRALAILDGALEVGEHAELLCTKSEVLFELGNVEAARDCVQRLLTLDPEAEQDVTRRALAWAQMAQTRMGDGAAGLVPML